MAYLTNGGVSEPIPVQVLDWLNDLENRLRLAEAQLKWVADQLPTHGKD